MFSCDKIKKLLLGGLLLASVMAVPITAMARMSVDINIALPPLIQFAAPPEVVAIPETDVYTDPDLDVDIFFCNGWWWRPWQGHWYRSRDYRSGWAHYPHTPSFYNGLPSGWRHAYKEHRYKGREWNYQRISHEQLQQNWRDWNKNRYWEKQQNSGDKDLRSRSGSGQPSQIGQQQPSQSRVEKVSHKSGYRNENHKKGEKD
jgi:hypothetical protein